MSNYITGPTFGGQTITIKPSGISRQPESQSTLKPKRSGLQQITNERSKIDRKCITEYVRTVEKNEVIYISPSSLGLLSLISDKATMSEDYRQTLTMVGALIAAALDEE